MVNELALFRKSGPAAATGPAGKCPGYSGLPLPTL
jgi:hypothetical protein